MNDLNFKVASAGSSRDFVVTTGEVGGASTQGSISFRVFKLSAFTITYPTNSGTSDVFPGVANSNSEWDFVDSPDYITVTSKAGVLIGANSNKKVGLTIGRKTGIPDNTSQNLTVSLVAGSGGEQVFTNNLSGVGVWAKETPTPLAFTITADSVQLNPYGYTPLSASVRFAVSALGRTYIRVNGKHGPITNVENTFSDKGVWHSVPVIGLYANYANTVDIQVVDDGGQVVAQSSVTIQTNALSTNIPLSTSITTIPFSETNVAPGLILVSSFSNIGTGKPSTPYFLDAYGEIRWVLDYQNHPQLNTLSYDDGISRLQNGNFFFANQNAPANAPATIYEVDLLGKVVNSWGLSGYTFHHEVREKPDGNFLLTANLPGSTYLNGNPTVEDYVIEVDRQSSALVNVWDLKQSLNENRNNLDNLRATNDWFHGNAVWYDASDNTIVVSGRTQGVVKLDYSNNVKWIMGAHTGWGMNRRGENLDQFLLKPLDAASNLITDANVIAGTSIAPDFEWNWYQHNINRLPNGDWMLFDNGAARQFDGNYAPKYSRAVSYKIDPVNLTVQQTWTYGKERAGETYSQIVSSAQFLPLSNHVLFGPGYQAPTASGGKGGKIVEIDFATKQVLSEIAISNANLWGFHRAIKMSAYP